MALNLNIVLVSVADRRAGYHGRSKEDATMTAVPNEDRHGSIQTWARIAGVLFLLTIVAGGFGEFYVPSRLIVSGDAAATAKNIHDSGWLFRLGFASYLVEAVCDIALALILYVLLRPVRKDL